MGVPNLPMRREVLTPNWHGMVEFGLAGLLVLVIIVRLMMRG